MEEIFCKNKVKTKKLELIMSFLLLKSAHSWYTSLSSLLGTWVAAPAASAHCSSVSVYASLTEVSSRWRTVEDTL